MLFGDWSAYVVRGPRKSLRHYSLGSDGILRAVYWRVGVRGRPAGPVRRPPKQLPIEESRFWGDVETLGDVLDVLAEMKAATDDPYVMGVLAACEDLVEAS
jgi:hypothetical protein